MQKTVCFLLLFAVVGNKALAQDTTRQPAFDSAAVLNDLLSLLDSADTPASYGMVSVGMGNRLFSIRNNRLNARQSSTSTLVFNPTLGYYDKSGFSISAAGSFLNDAAKGFGATQYSFTPAYDYNGSSDWGFGIAYSRYLVSDKYSVYASPIQNDLYAYGNYKKYWLEPGIALGYSTGQYKEINRFTVQATGNTYVDTGTYNIKAFSMIGSVSHDFEWSAVLGKEDVLGITPSLMMNFGYDSTTTVSHTIFPNLIRFLKRRNRLPKFSGENKFGVQSVGMSLDLSYAIGSFTILPQLYLDYYIPETTEKRFTQTFTLSVGYAF